MFFLIVCHEVRIELGPLGTIAVDCPRPAPLGVQIDVHEVPATQRNGDLAAPLTGNVAAYAALVGNP